MLIRSWNLFHGNSVPPGRKAYLEEMVRLAVEDRPDILLLQELPAWAVARVGEWAAMTAVGDVAQHPRFGPLPISAGLGRRLTALNEGLLRSAFSGQGQAILLGEGLRPTAHEVLTLNPFRFRRAVSRRLGLDVLTRLHWAKERRICQLVRVLREDGPSLVVTNLHATSSPADARIPEAEVRRATDWVETKALPGDVVLLGGDFNYAARIEGYSAPGQRIDHLFVRGAEPSDLRVWPEDRRRRDGILLSDHAPVELEIP